MWKITNFLNLLGSEFFPGWSKGGSFPRSLLLKAKKKKKFSDNIDTEREASNRVNADTKKRNVYRGEGGNTSGES